jgi:hypothetical protein
VTLPYGQELRRGRIGCLSEEAALTCKTVVGTGFTLSAAPVKLLYPTAQLSNLHVRPECRENAFYAFRGPLQGLQAARPQNA